MVWTDLRRKILTIAKNKKKTQNGTSVCVGVSSHHIPGDFVLNLILTHPVVHVKLSHVVIPRTFMCDAYGQY